ncbi:MAG TPA: thiamine pyrophosphate-dependent enzyme, partial [Acidimicrobiia bacterium]|nr:thiamine pyrophosphate-dependent enzyme [Acidimicrobiia bacterium]
TAAPRGRPDDAAVARIVEFVRAHPRGVLALGWGGGAQASTIARVAAATGWPVLADPISNLRTGAHAISTYEALLRSGGFARSHVPDLVVRVGAPLTSKVAQAWLDGSGAPTVVVDPQDAWLDPTGTASERIVAGADATLGVIADARTEPDADGAAWCASWQAAEHAAREAIDRVLDAGPACEGRIARDVATAVPDGGALVVASSLPVRALEWCMSPRSGLHVFANRGANGIDGFVSTARGIARADRGPVVALCGDLCFLHDANGLLDTEGAAGATAGPTFVVIDNGGGGIFSYLPQHELPAAEFRRLFATPQVTDVVELARAHGVDAVRVDSVDDVDLLAAGGTRVVVVPVDPEAARDQHRRCWEAVARAAGRVDA